MDDLGEALNVNPDLIFMGGGNPASIPEVEAEFAELLQYLSNDAAQLQKMLGVYQSPQGDEQFREVLAGFLSEKLAWPITPEHIAICNGSQSAFFVLFNLLAGERDDGSCAYIDLPLCPEYLGYADLGLDGDLFRSIKPRIEITGDHEFKYFIDFDALKLDSSSAAVAVSRPTNPTGNVITIDEIKRLQAMTADLGIPLIIDGAYGAPFPNIIFSESQIPWSDNTVVVLSLSKLGLPGVRTGIVIGEPRLMKHFAHANTLMALAAGNLGPAMGAELVKNRKMQGLSDQYVRPFYESRAAVAVALLNEKLETLPYYIHKPEGAIFLWLWFEGLPISSKELYSRLKRKGVLVVSGEAFFVGLDDKTWPHQYECIRLTYGLGEEKLVKGIEILAAELKQLYKK